VTEKSGAEAILQLYWLTSFNLSVTICYLFSMVKKNLHVYEFSQK